MGTLYVVATPIGNLEDLTLRAIRILSEVSLIAAEDTRQSRKLLTHLGISKRIVSYNQHNADQRTPRLLRSLLQEDVALVTDAGVPAISDPGADLVRAAAEQGNNVIPIPGPSAVTAALSVSGMGGDTFRFVGFLPRTRKARRDSLSKLEPEPTTLIFFESPHRIRAMLEDLATVFLDRPITVCRELTKLHEEVFRGTSTEALAHFDYPRGEFVVVVRGGSTRIEIVRDEEGARAALNALKAQGQTRRDAVTQVTEAYAVSKREAYRLWLGG